MKKDVTRERLVKSLETTVKLTHMGNMELDCLRLYDNNTVEIVYKNGYIKEVPIGGDSGIAILGDVLNKI